MDDAISQKGKLFFLAQFLPYAILANLSVANEHPLFKKHHIRYANSEIERKMSRTILGTLTTTFTPPPRCTTLLVEERTEDRLRLGLWGNSCLVSGPSSTITNEFDLGCYPTGAVYYIDGPGEDFADAISTLGAFSGSICPQGFRTACTYTKSADFSFNFAQQLIQRALNEGETYVGCCPL